MIIGGLLLVVYIKLAAVLLNVLFTRENHHQPVEELCLAGICDALDHQCLLLQIFWLQELIIYSFYELAMTRIVYPITNCLDVTAFIILFDELL